MFGDFQKGTPENRNIRFEVREHAAMRVSALSEAGVIYAMTHDSIGVGEYGPTHELTEHLTSSTSGWSGPATTVGPTVIGTTGRNMATEHPLRMYKHRSNGQITPTVRSTATQISPLPLPAI